MTPPCDFTPLVPGRSNPSGRQAGTALNPGASGPAEPPSQVRAVRGLLSPVLHQITHTHTHTRPQRRCLSPRFTAVSCHSLMDAPGPTIAHYSLLLLSLHSRSRQGHIYLTVAHLSHSARVTFVLHSAKKCVRLGKGGRGRRREGDRMTERRWKGNYKTPGELPCEQM